VKKFFPVYPILLGVIWVLVTYSNNASILPSVSVITIPLLVVVGIIAALWGVVQLLVRDWRKSALVVAVMFCLTVFHGYIRDYTETSGAMASPIWLALMAVGVFAVIKMTRPKGRLHLTVVSNVLCIAILSVSIFSVSISSRASDMEYEYEPVAVNSIHNPTPDVYYIIPDTYTSFTVLEDYLGYDNSRFLTFLEDRGFYVSEDSYANYHHSILSISSVMNMRYWTDEELSIEGPAALGAHLTQNPVGDTFKEADYTYVHIGSWWGFTAKNVRADITPVYSSLRELDFTLYKTTLWYDLADVLFGRGGNYILREAHLKQFDNLVAVSKMEEATFTFCHSILPHPPFLFEADGTHTSGWMVPPEEWRRMYLAQLEFTTTKLMEAIDGILANSEVTPIIILSADEGYAGTAWKEYWEGKQGLDTIMEDRPDLVAKRHGNLYAVLNPYGDSLPLPASPVNTFRYVFNSLFDSQLEYLPDRYFLKSMGEYEHEFIEITGKLR